MKRKIFLAVNIWIRIFYFSYNWLRIFYFIYTFYFVYIYLFVVSLDLSYIAHLYYYLFFILNTFLVKGTWFNSWFIIVYNFRNVCVGIGCNMVVCKKRLQCYEYLWNLIGLDKYFIYMMFLLIVLPLCLKFFPVYFSSQGMLFYFKITQ